jgi:hypothetical protein
MKIYFIHWNIQSGRAQAENGAVLQQQQQQLGVRLPPLHGILLTLQYSDRRYSMRYFFKKEKDRFQCFSALQISFLYIGMEGHSKIVCIFQTSIGLKIEIY